MTRYISTINNQLVSAENKPCICDRCRKFGNGIVVSHENKALLSLCMEHAGKYAEELSK